MLVPYRRVLSSDDQCRFDTMLHHVRIRRAAGVCSPFMKHGSQCFCRCFLELTNASKNLSNNLHCFRKTSSRSVKKMDNEVIGWILDAHLCSTQQEILVWIATEAGPVVEHRETWHPTFHVSGNRKDLQNLIDWLWQPELRLRYGIRSYAFEMKRTELGSFDMQHLLSITLHSCATLRSLAEHIDARGEHVRFTLYSVDVRPEQQFLTSKRLTIGSSVRLHDNQLTSFERICCRLDFTSTSAHESFEIRVVPCDTSGNIIGTESVFVLSESEQLSSLNNGSIISIQILFFQCVEIRKDSLAFFPILWPRTSRSILGVTKHLFAKSRSTSGILSSYGNVLRSDPQFPLEGRIHIDLSSSLCFEKAGLMGCMNLLMFLQLELVTLQKISWFGYQRNPIRDGDGRPHTCALEEKHVRRGYKICLGFVAVPSRRTLLGQSLRSLCKRD